MERVPILRFERYASVKLVHAVMRLAEKYLPVTQVGHDELW